MPLQGGEEGRQVGRFVSDDHVQADAHSVKLGINAVDRELVTPFSAGDPGIMCPKPCVAFEFSVLKGAETDVKRTPDPLPRQQNLPGQRPDIAASEHREVSGSYGQGLCKIFSKREGLRIRILGGGGSDFPLPASPPAKWQERHGQPYEHRDHCCLDAEELNLGRLSHECSYLFYQMHVNDLEDLLEPGAPAH